MTLFNPNEQTHQTDSVEIMTQQEQVVVVELGENGDDIRKKSGLSEEEGQELSSFAAIRDHPQDDDAAPDDNNDDDDNNEENKKYACYKKTAVGLVLLAFIVFVIADAFTNQYIRTAILQFLEWIEGHPVAGVLSFILVYFVATIFFVPGSILTLGAGFVFSASFDSLWRGVLLGTCAVFIGASLGAIASFLLGRYLFRDGFVGRLTQKYKVFGALDNALADKGLRIMVLLRLSPIVPFNALNYIAGVTGIKFWHYTLACFGMLPGTILYVFLGASAGSLSEIGGGDGDEGDGDGDGETEGENKTVTISVIVVGVVFGFLAVAVTSYYAKLELNKVLDAEKEDEGDDDDNEGDGGNENEDDSIDENENDDDVDEEEAANNNINNV